jgi:hypothetical protein
LQSNLKRSKYLHIAGTVQFWVCSLDCKLEAIASLNTRLVRLPKNEHRLVFKNNAMKRK